MDDRLVRGLGGCSVLGALVGLVAAVPTSWYGAPDSDAYVFDPAPFSPLWIERTLVPAASVAAIVLLAVGLAGLLARDWPVAGRLRKAGTGLAVFALLLLSIPAIAFALTQGAASAGFGAAFAVLLALLPGLVGLLALPVGELAAGVGYARTDRPVVGYALAGGAVLGTAIAVGGTLVEPPSWLGGMPFAFTVVAPFVVVGHELWTHPEPVPEPDADDAPREREDAPPDDEETAPEWERREGEPTDAGR